MLQASNSTRFRSYILAVFVFTVCILCTSAIAGDLTTLTHGWMELMWLEEKRKTIKIVKLDWIKFARDRQKQVWDFWIIIYTIAKLPIFSYMTLGTKIPITTATQYHQKESRFLRYPQRILQWLWNQCDICVTCSTMQKGNSVVSNSKPRFVKFGTNLTIRMPYAISWSKNRNQCPFWFGFSV